MVKETFAYNTAYGTRLAQRFRKALKKFNHVNWSVNFVAFGDQVGMSAYPNDFRKNSPENTPPDIVNGKTVFELSNHTWWRGGE